ncbi:flagellar motor protein MotB [Paenibacillus macquariensis]|uniref:Chemotaxis protein MotB n=1 Tax=Paenibacillus macquariensis TaxID=948756 RepID=A0ABY1KGM7_9BACL|nr:flagellar motor protein MotB [Paenibacillus macquariensis]MEC0093397.1 flagellar motor protein MotB [Paenibacillus macquariensis]OAB29292.1 flagellar motor protein MotB [Paenibacillus macquariensis subsp. macquariensis]SIR63654.1 chemotaxis protein MotB [Paenibacillus macquariensis]
MSKKSRRHEHEEHADESWLLPYADLLTLLLALFIVLYSMSASDAKKFDEMSEAFNAAFTSGTGVLDYQSPVSTNQVTSKDETVKNKDDVTSKKDKRNEQQALLSKQEQIDLEKLKKQIDQYIQKSGLTNQLETKLNQSQLMITISDTALFASGKATVKPESKQLAAAISDMLQKFPDYDIVVSGHTDNIPIYNMDYESNWDLSSARALEFLKILLLNTNLDPKKFTPVGYGEYHPIVDNSTAVNRAKNRRVEVSLIRKYQDSTQLLNVTDVKE